MIHGLHHVSLLVGDLGSALAFYQGVLGLPLDEGRPDLGYPGAWLHLADGRQIHLLCLPSPEPGPETDRPAQGGRTEIPSCHSSTSAGQEAPMPRGYGYPGAAAIHGGRTEIPSCHSSTSAIHGGRDRHCALLVENLDALAATLEQAGVSCTRSRSGRRALFCRDPDGNALELIESPRPNL